MALSSEVSYKNVDSEDTMMVYEVLNIPKVLLEDEVTAVVSVEAVGFRVNIIHECCHGGQQVIPFIFKKM